MYTFPAGRQPSRDTEPLPSVRPSLVVCSMHPHETNSVCFVLKYPSTILFCMDEPACRRPSAQAQARQCPVPIRIPIGKAGTCQPVTPSGVPCSVGRRGQAWASVGKRGQDAGGSLLPFPPSLISGAHRTRAGRLSEAASLSDANSNVLQLPLQLHPPRPFKG